MKTIVIEGTDGVGKSTVIKALDEYFQSHYIPVKIKDRDRDTISANMMFDINMVTRTNNIREYLKNNDVIVIFMVNTDSEELMRRIRTREKPISDFDLDAPKYNDLYLETFKQMDQFGMTENKLAMVDVTDDDKTETFNTTLTARRTLWPEAR